MHQQDRDARGIALPDKGEPYPAGKANSVDLPVAAHRLILGLVWRARRLRPSLTGQRSRRPLALALAAPKLHAELLVTC
jgi:hypothetical protein